MKKVLFFLGAMFLLSCVSVNAAESIVYSMNDISQIQDKINNIGFKILNSNGIEKRTVFYFDTSKTTNAYSNSTNRQIVLYRGLYTKLDNDTELAAVLSHEISHSVDSYDGIFRGYFSPLTYYYAPKKYEYKADKRAVDYMVNAGYNPVSLIIVMNKIFPQTRYDWCSTHPLTTRRMMEVYEYIYKKYPEYLAKNEYKNNIYYQNFLLTSKANRAKFQNKIETKAKGKVSYQ
jgi:predicted Zn-dependent protease